MFGLQQYFTDYHVLWITRWWKYMVSDHWSLLVAHYCMKGLYKMGPDDDNDANHLVISVGENRTRPEVAMSAIRPTLPAWWNIHSHHDFIDHVYHKKHHCHCRDKIWYHGVKEDMVKNGGGVKRLNQEVEADKGAMMIMVIAIIIMIRMVVTMTSWWFGKPPKNLPYPNS